MMIHGAATLGFAKYDLPTAVQRLAGLGFRGVEISTMGWHSKHFPHGRADPAAVGKLLADHGIKPLSMNICTFRALEPQVTHFDFTKGAEAQASVDQARWYLQCAKAMGIKVLTLGTARRVFGEQWHLIMKPACAAFRQIGQIADELGVSVNLEVPHLFLITDTVEHAQAVFDEIDHPAVGATVDSSHWGIIGYDLDAFLKWLGPRLRHVHLRDSAGPDTKDGKQALELTAGRGSVDFVRFREALQRVNYGGRVTLDFEYKIDDLNTIEAEYRHGMAHLRACGWKFDLAEEERVLTG